MKHSYSSHFNGDNGHHNSDFRDSHVHCHTTLEILQATYGPSEGRRLLNGTLVDSTNKASYVPYTRDVLPFLWALMTAGPKDNDQRVNSLCCNDVANNSDDDSVISGNLYRDSKIYFNKTSFPLMDGRSMNSVFGDPCPGTTKLLRVNYVFKDYFINTCGGQESEADVQNDGLDSAADGAVCSIKLCASLSQKSKSRKRTRHCVTSRIYQSTFAEHDRVLLKRQDVPFRLDSNLCSDHAVLEVNAISHASKRSQESHFAQMNESVIAALNPEKEQFLTPSSSPPPSSYPSYPSYPFDLRDTTEYYSLSSSRPSSSIQWRLAPTTSEITLPIILPYLNIRQRALCQLVCSSWRDIVIDKGIAVVIDVNDVTLFPKEKMCYSSTTTGTSRTAPFIPQSPSNVYFDISSSPSTSAVHNEPSRILLRGLLTHSFSSLESLVLNDYLPLRPSIDLHPTLPYFRKLKQLDISRIPSISDETLLLISTYIGHRLEVLYMKGLRHVTNAGVLQLVKSCTNLHVLDVSHLHQLEDEVGIAIGLYLPKLKALHCRDNYKWTNLSVDLIMRNCKELVQASFWGCIQLTHICFKDIFPKELSEVKPSTELETASSLCGTELLLPSCSLFSTLDAEPAKMTILNLWGCHNLKDSSAFLMSELPHLSSLCVSECHKLTDAFVLGISQSLPQLLHLQLRYLRRITEASIDAIACRMTGLYTLDVSFCTKLTEGSLARLLHSRCQSLSELRLYSCRQLNIGGGAVASSGRNVNVSAGIRSGRLLCQALRAVRHKSILSFLDVRRCHFDESLAQDELFSKDMLDFGFNEVLQGLFLRSATCNESVKQQLISKISYSDGYSSVSNL